MNYKIKNYISILIGITLLSSTSWAQFEKKAQVGMKFLTNPVSAEVVARGTAGINATFNSNGIFWNPALTSRINSQLDVSLNYQQWIADISYNSAAVSWNAFNFGVVTLSGTMVDYGELYETIRSSNSQGFEETGTFSPSAYAVGIGFSQKVSDKFSYGVNIKYVNQDLGDAWIAVGDSLTDPNYKLQQVPYSKGVPAVDIGTFYDFQYKGITFAAALSNVSREIKFQDEPVPLPFSVSFGATVAPLEFFMENMKDNRLILCVESNHPRDFKEKLKFGLEYTYMDMFIVRGGYVTNVDERGLTAGVGLRKTISDIPVRVDYGYQNAGIFGNTHFFTVGFSY